jgi:hypothetical protein
MKKIALLLLACFARAFAYTQTYTIDSVYLKNDSLIVCKILRHKPDKFVKVQVGDGAENIFRIEMKNVSRLVKDSALLAKEEKIRLRREKISLSDEKVLKRQSKNCYFKGMVERDDCIGVSYFKKGGYFYYSCSLHHNDKLVSGKGTFGYYGTNLILGCQLYKKLFIGAGIGFNLSLGSNTSSYGYPFFLDLRYYFTKKNTQPFINLSSGILLNEGNFQKPNAYYYHSFFNPSAGIKVFLGKNHNMDISLGSSLLFTKKNYLMFYFDHDTFKETSTMETVQSKIMGLIVKIGFTF